MNIANTYEAEYSEFFQQKYNNELVAYAINTIHFFDLKNKIGHKDNLYDIDKPNYKKQKSTN